MGLNKIEAEDRRIADLDEIVKQVSSQMSWQHDLVIWVANVDRDITFQGSEGTEGSVMVRQMGGTFLGACRLPVDPTDALFSYLLVPEEQSLVLPFAGLEQPKDITVFLPSIERRDHLPVSPTDISQAHSPTEVRRLIRILRRMSRNNS